MTRSPTAASVFQVDFEQDTFSQGGGAAWVARDPALPGTVGYGATREEARDMLVASRDAFIRVLESQGAQAPFAVPDLILMVTHQQETVLFPV